MSLPLTPEQIAAHNAKVLAGRIAYKIGGPRSGKMLALEEAEKKAIAAGGSVLRIAPTVTTLPPKKKPLMNKTELAFYEVLKQRYQHDDVEIYCQAWMLRLADGCQYRPDFAVIHHPEDWQPQRGFPAGVITIDFYETKAPHRFAEKGIIKARMAAREYPHFTFHLVMRNKKEWTEQILSNE